MSRQKDGLAAFFVLVFAYTWGVAALYELFPAAVGTVSSSLTSASRSMFSNPLLLSAVSSPTLAALIVASFLGRASIVDLIKRLLNWRIAWYWYVAATVGIATLALVARIASTFAFGLGLPHFSITQLPALATASVLDPGPFVEELGWRGFALPRLLDRYNGLTVALVLGSTWGVWHLPAFFISGMPQSQDSIWIFMIIVISTTVLMTWVVNRARGSVLPAILIHWSINRFVEGHYPGAMMSAVIFAVAALILVAIVGTELDGKCEGEGTADALRHFRGKP
jgi:membrane protease YdiL (CAAX protease family)